MPLGDHSLGSSSGWLRLSGEDYFLMPDLACLRSESKSSEPPLPWRAPSSFTESEINATGIDQPCPPHS